MDEVIVRGLVIGAVFMALGLAANLVWKLIRSPSEGARRIKWVISAVLALGVAALVVQSFGFAGLFWGAVVLGTVVWIVRGFRTKPGKTKS